MMAGVAVVAEKRVRASVWLRKEKPRGQATNEQLMRTHLELDLASKARGRALEM